MEQRNQHTQKKTFNKKKWRETQYSHKQRVAEWENKRKLAVKRKYNKLLRKEESQQATFTRTENPKTTGSNTDAGETQQTSKRPLIRMSELQRARQEFERIRQLKEEERQAREQKLKEREEAIQKSKQERLERIKKLTQKTKKGQPVMKGRIEILLDKIQKQVSNEKS